MPQTSLKLGDRLLLIGDEGGREGELSRSLVGLGSNSTFRRNLNLRASNAESPGKGAATAR